MNRKDLIQLFYKSNVAFGLANSVFVPIKNKKNLSIFTWPTLLKVQIPFCNIQIARLVKVAIDNIVITSH
jgi:hypothetical protein